MIIEEKRGKWEIIVETHIYKIVTEHCNNGNPNERAADGLDAQDLIGLNNRSYQLAKKQKTSVFFF
jgi:hypothetical protein